MPRYRQKLAYPRFEMGRPLWVDDPRFNLDYHVRHTALPSPGSVEQLRMLAGRIFSQRLDRSKPLWELWLVQGLEDNRFALINKTHHCARGRRLGRGHHDGAVRHLADADPGRAPRAGRRSVEPSDATLVAEGVKGIVRLPGARSRAARSTRRAIRRETAAELREAAEGLGGIAWKLCEPAAAARRSTCRSARTGACCGSASRSRT